MFSKQSEAIDFSKCFSGELKVFAFETDLSGRRNFVVCHPNRFWTLYDAKDASKRHDYEVIVEDAASKLYFDLEFKSKLNPEVNPEHLMKKFKELLVTFLKQTFGVAANAANFIDLDSSTDDKFSRHLIVDNVVFKNNYHVGNFVRAVCSKFEEDKSHLVRLSECVDDLGVFVDQGVYTTNRNFRLYLSSKFGKSAVLKLESSCRERFSGRSGREIFLASLVTFCPNTNPNRRLTFGPDVSTTSVKILSTITNKSMSSSTAPTSSSPFPEIDNFFRKLVSEEGGYIRKWFIGGGTSCRLVNFVF